MVCTGMLLPITQRSGVRICVVGNHHWGGGESIKMCAGEKSYEQKTPGLSSPLPKPASSSTNTAASPPAQTVWAPDLGSHFMQQPSHSLGPTSKSNSFWRRRQVGGRLGEGPLLPPSSIPCPEPQSCVLGFSAMQFYFQKCPLPPQSDM